MNGVTDSLGQTVSGGDERARADRQWRDERGDWGATVRRRRLNNTLNGVTGDVNGITNSLGLGSVCPAPRARARRPARGPPRAPRSTTTTTTAPGLVGGLTKTVGGLLGGE